MTAPRDALWLYAVRRGATVPPDVPDMHGTHRYEWVVNGDLAALATPTVWPDDEQSGWPEALGNVETLLPWVGAFTAAIDALSAQGTVIPFKFATVVRNHASAVSLLARHSARFAHLLDTLHGSDEWGVKVFGDPKKRAARLASADDTSDRSERGRRYLQRKKLERDMAGHIAELFSQDVAHIGAALAGTGHPCRSNAPQGEQRLPDGSQPLHKFACLVPRDATASFETLVTHLQADLMDGAITLVLTGPWVPYSFCDDAESAE